MEKKRIVLTFPPHLIEHPVTYNLIKDYEVTVNILKAKISPGEVGRLVAEISGEREAVVKAEQYLAELGIEMEPLALEMRYHEDRCVHCTACVPVCATGAWDLDRETMLVSFQEEKCVLCELCPPVCPYRAMEIMF